MAEIHRRRRRVLPTGPASPARLAGSQAWPLTGPPTEPRTTGPQAPTPTGAPAAPPTGPRTVGDDDRDSERGLRGLVGSGATQVPVAAAMRARDAARPTDADLAAAAANLVIIRRGWTPPPPAE